MKKDFRVKGFLFSGISAGIKKNESEDLGLIYSEVPSQVAGVFTTNKVKAAPLELNMERIKRGVSQAVMINSGNANACTGKRGLRDARKISSFLAKNLRIDDNLVLLSSTGVIGVPLPVEKIERGIPELIERLSPDGWWNTVRAIMTTDTFPKSEVETCKIYGSEVKLCGMAKGAGMICPHMATMLSFLVTDINIRAPLLQLMLCRAVDQSFNRITVDGEMSTNDMVLILANGKAGNPPINQKDRGAELFYSMLLEVTKELAKSIVKDGEGATKLIEIVVRGCKNKKDAERAAYAIAHSPLVKTAFFGEDANWGRIISALGHADIRVNPDRIDLFFDKVPVVRNGVGLGGQFEKKAESVLKKKNFKVVVDLHQGKGEFSILTTDLSLDYVKINASYRS